MDELQLELAAHISPALLSNRKQNFELKMGHSMDHDV